MGYISQYTSPKTGITKLKVFWREDAPNGKVIQHSKTLPEGTSWEDAERIMLSLEAETISKVKYSDVGHLSVSFNKEGVPRFVAHWKERTSDEKIIHRRKTLPESMTKTDALRFLKHKEKQFNVSRGRRSLF